MFDAFSEDFEQFKAELQEKWLDYWEENEDLIRTLGIEKFGTCINDKYGYHFYPKPEFMLSVLGTKDPRIKDFILFLRSLKLSSELAQVVITLDLSGDPFVLLKKRQKEREESQKQSTSLTSELSDTEYLDQIRQKMNQTE
jgi:hypothetical protein